MENRGGKREGAGRRKGSVGAYKEVTKKNYTLKAYPADIERMKEKAEEKGMSLSEFVTDTILGEESWKVSR